MEETVSISDASKETGFSERQLRNFEARGYIETPLKVRSGSIQYRRFSKSHIQAIKIFKKYLDQGYKLAFASQKAFEELAKEVKE
jgi:DNA-binding transcriptional MerR regulator